jgi:hypothetical protein
MEERRLTIPRRALSKLKDLLIPQDTPSDSSLCLSIIIEDSEVNLSEFAAYLTLIDSTYGRLSTKGINAYSMRREEQLKIYKFGHGSLALEFVKDIASEHGFQIFILYLLLKYLPMGLEKLSVTYKNYQEGRLLSLRRKILRRQIREDIELANLPEAGRKQLIILIDELLFRGRRFLPKASRFGKKYVRHINIKVIPHPEKEQEDKRR